MKKIENNNNKNNNNYTLNTYELLFDWLKSVFYLNVIMSIIIIVSIKIEI